MYNSEGFCTECIYVSPVIIRIDSVYFLNQRQPTGFYNGIFKYYLEDFGFNVLNLCLLYDY